MASLRPGGMRELFEHLPNTLFFVKDADLRLMAGNQAFVQRCGYACEEELIGRMDREIFPEELAAKYGTDDRQVIDSGKPLLGIVELFPNQLGDPEWFVTDKVPVFAASGEAVGVCGTVRSYEGARAALQPYLDLVPVIDHFKEHYHENISIPDVAKRAGMSVRLLQRRFQSTLKTTPREFMMKLRVHAACELLTNSQSTMTDIAVQVGFYDHSVFSRQFSRLMGMSPSAYRQRRRVG
jgi:PAS domain S-box-containing protein